MNRPRVNVQPGIEIRRVGPVYLVGLPSGVKVARDRAGAERIVKRYCKRTSDAGAINACVVTWTEVEP